MSDVFEEVNEFAKQAAEGFEVEHAVMINKEHRVLTAGVNIMAVEFHGPVFLSVDELRRLADESEKRTQELIDQQN